MSFAEQAHDCPLDYGSFRQRSVTGPSILTVNVLCPNALFVSFAVCDAVQAVTPRLTHDMLHKRCAFDAGRIIS